MKKQTLIQLIQQSVKMLPDDQAFLADLKATVAKLNPPRPRSQHYKPSSLHCLRQMYFDKIQAPMDSSYTEYSSVRISETGTNSHERIQYYVTQMKSCGHPCDFVDVSAYIEKKKLDYLQVIGKKQYETKLFDTRYGISFLCDGIIYYNDKYYILEIKTETDDKGIYRESADPYHEKQSVCYSLSLGINDVMWIYEERNFCVPKTFITHITDEQKAQLLIMFDTVEQAVKDLKAPPRTDSKKTCNYCVYKTVCKQNGR